MTPPPIKSFGFFHVMHKIPQTQNPLINHIEMDKNKYPYTPDSPDTNELSGLPEPSGLRRVPSSNALSITKNKELSKVKKGPKLKTTSRMTLVHKTGQKWSYKSANINSGAIGGEKKSTGGVAKGQSKAAGGGEKGGRRAKVVGVGEKDSIE
jgi:hypothetical protein